MGLVGHFALGTVGVGVAQRAADLFETDSVVVQRVDIQLDANPGQRTAADRYLAHALNLRELLGQDRIGRVIDQAAAQGARGQRQDQNRRIGRVHFFVGWVARQIGRQLAARRVDRGLHVACGRIDIAVQVELQNDVGGSKRAGRRKFGQRGDMPELALQRSRHRRRHRLRAGAGQSLRSPGWSENRLPATARPAATGMRPLPQARSPQSKAWSRPACV